MNPANHTKMLGATKLYPLLPLTQIMVALRFWKWQIRIIAIIMVTTECCESHHCDHHGDVRVTVTVSVIVKAASC